VYAATKDGLTQKFSGGVGSGGGSAHAISVFADLDGVKGDELIAGNTAYLSDGTVLWTRPDLPDGFNAVADFDGDGIPDVVLAGNGALWVLDGPTGATRVGPMGLAGTGLGGPPVVADIDGDGLLDIGVAMLGTYNVATVDLKSNKLAPKWTMPTHDLKSSVSGSIAFDFDGNGTSDIAYADSCFLWIFDGATGNVQFASPRTSFGTTAEPIVGDLDGDGHADVVMMATGADPSAAGWGCLDASGQPTTVNGVTWNGSGSASNAYRGLTVFSNQAWSSVSSQPTPWNEHSYRSAKGFRAAAGSQQQPPPQCPGDPNCPPQGPPDTGFTVDAGPDVTVTFPQQVTLVAITNQLPFCFQCYFVWVEGNQQLAALDSIGPTVTTPVLLLPGTHHVTLNASANTGTSFASDTVTITVLPDPNGGGGGAAGPTGPTGPMGPTGPQGADGKDGAPGANGAQGPTGAVGPTGAAGANGAVGPTGPTGPAGPQGPIGAKGATGSNGSNGATGPQGPTGSAGAPGAPGATGATGPAGKDGKDGSGTGSYPTGSVIELVTGATPPSGFVLVGTHTLTLRPPMPAKGSANAEVHIDVNVYVKQ
jgi:hypothetical protein